MNTRALAEHATATALRLRTQHRLGLIGSICPYDLALTMGIEVRFVSSPSLEGIYRAGAAPVIVLNSLRPAGRRAYNCAHEIGHHMLGHGTRVDELLEGVDAGFDPDEYAADRFASALLLPKAAVGGAFTARGQGVATATPIEMFAVACFLGVGYTTLIGYVERTLGILPQTRAVELRRHSPKSIRRELVGADHAFGVFLVDENWRGRPIDVEIGDLLIVEDYRGVHGNCVELSPTSGGSVLKAVRPGKGTIEIGSSSLAVRVCRREYVGLGEYRHLEDPDHA